MILHYGVTKFRELQDYMSTGFAVVYAGSATAISAYPKLPRLPMFPNQNIEKTWLEYFRKIHDILDDHLSDYDMHRIK